MESAFRCKSGEIRHALVSMEAMTLSGIDDQLNLVVLVDLTDRKRLELQLLQAQKLEAVVRALARELLEDHMSGYTDDIIAHRGVLASGTLLLGKPFTALALLRCAREALGGRDTGEHP